MQLLPTFRIEANRPLNVEMARESLRLRARQSVHARTTVVLAGLVAGLSFAFAAPPWRVAAWAASVALLAQWNAWVCARVLPRLDQADAEALGRHQSTLWGMTVLNQVAMGLTVWWIGYGNAGTAATIATTLQLIYLGGALVNASTHPPTFITGAWVNLGIAALFWLTQSDVGWPLAVALVGMGLVMSKSCRQTAAAFEDSLRMRFENAQLLERLAHEKQAAEEANAAKSRFLASASHDLRQPLHALLVFSTLLQKARTPQTAELVDHIRSAATSLDKLFAGLLDISKLDTGGIAAQLQAVNMGAMANALVAEYEPACRDKGIGIAAVLPPQPQWVLSDPFLLERVLRNLVDNAVKYTARGSVELRLVPAESQCVVEVVDTGLGIPAAMQPRVFEEYFQVGNAARDLTKGSGLGLAIVKRLCVLLNAPVELRSEEGVGSAFVLTLERAPIYDAIGVEGAEGSEDRARATAARRHVWLVEDNALVRLATRRALEDMGCRVTEWPGPPDPACTDAPQALVTDYRLDGSADGLQVAAEVRRSWPTLPVAVMTGDPGIDKAAAERLGNVLLLQKPVLPALLARWLHDSVDASTAPVPAPAPAAQAILTP